MQTDCIPDLFGFEAVEGRPVAAAFDGGSITSEAGAMLLGATDRAIGVIESVCRLLSGRALPGVDRARGQDADRPAGVRTGARL